MKRGMFVFFGSASVLFAMPGESYAQSGKTWSLRACIEHAREHNIQVAYTRVALENTRVELARDRDNGCLRWIFPVLKVGDTRKKPVRTEI